MDAHAASVCSCAQASAEEPPAKTHESDSDDDSEEEESSSVLSSLSESVDEPPHKQAKTKVRRAARGPEMRTH